MKASGKMITMMLGMAVALVVGAGVANAQGQTSRPFTGAKVNAGTVTQINPPFAQTRPGKPRAAPRATSQSKLLKATQSVSEPPRRWCEQTPGDSRASASQGFVLRHP